MSENSDGAIYYNAELNYLFIPSDTLKPNETLYLLGYNTIWFYIGKV